MTRTQILALRQSELRTKIGDMLDTPAETRAESFDDDLSKVTREMRSLETEIQAAIVSEGPEPETRTDTPEGRELRSVIDRASVGLIVDAVLNHRSVLGAEDELQRHFNLQGNQVPLALLQLETRAVTNAPTQVQQNAMPVIPYVFPGSCSAFLGVDMPTVASGETIFPVLTSVTSVEALAEHGARYRDGRNLCSRRAAAEPSAGQSFFYSREDRARFSALESALRENLAMAMADGLDKAVINGANGILMNVTVRTGDAGAEATFGDYRSLLYDAIHHRRALCDDGG